MVKTSGQIAYEAYCNATGGVSLISGDKLPEFDSLKQAIKDAWEVAAQAVIYDWKISNDS